VRGVKEAARVVDQVRTVSDGLNAVSKSKSADPLGF